MLVHGLPRRISIINHTLPSIIRAVIGTPGTSIASNSTSASECYWAVRVPGVYHLIVRGIKCVIN